jgi:hypothetical protein
VELIEMQKIMLVHPEGDLNVNVNLTGLLTLLCEQGYEVHYYCFRIPGIVHVAPCPGVTVVHMEGKHLGMIATYGLIIGIDRDGIILAASIARQLKIPWGFISYEIFFAAETGADFKQPEIDACAGISFAVCQGGERSRWLASENQIEAGKIIHMPVAGRGVRRGARSTFLHEALALPAEIKIALCMGNLAPAWAMVDELIDNTRQWDDSWLLVLHSRTASPALVERLRQRHGTPSRYRFTPESGLPLEGLQTLVKSADLGIGLYRPNFKNRYNGLNLQYIGLSSGKIATYLQHGVPVLVNDIGEMSAAVDEHRLGIHVHALADLPARLRDTSRPVLESWRENSYGYFEQFLDLNGRVSPLLDVIRRCIA